MHSPARRRALPRFRATPRTIALFLGLLDQLVEIGDDFLLLILHLFAGVRLGEARLHVEHPPGDIEHGIVRLLLGRRAQLALQLLLVRIAPLPCPVLHLFGLLFLAEQLPIDVVRRTVVQLLE